MKLEKVAGHMIKAEEMISELNADDCDLDGDQKLEQWQKIAEELMAAKYDLNGSSVRVPAQVLVQSCLMDRVDRMTKDAREASR